MFQKTLMDTRAQDLYLGAHKVRVSVSLNGRGGCYDPHVNLFLRGPNGSVSGVGPKPWPIFKRLTLTIPLPRVTWGRGYQLRRVGGLTAYKLIYRTYRGMLR